eukprot:350681-Pelagomonas_calceolata.AAC.1
MCSWLSLISQFEYPIRFLAAPAAAAAAAQGQGAGEAWAHSCSLRRTHLFISIQPCHTVLNTLEPMHAMSIELTSGGRPTGFFCFAGCPIERLGPFKPGLVCYLGGVTGLSHPR